MTENPATTGEGIELSAVDDGDADLKAVISDEGATLPSEHATKL